MSQIGRISNHGRLEDIDEWTEQVLRAGTPERVLALVEDYANRVRKKEETFVVLSRIEQAALLHGKVNQTEVNAAVRAGLRGSTKPEKRITG